VCAVLDGFHFPLPEGVAADGDDVQMGEAAAVAAAVAATAAAGADAVAAAADGIDQQQDGTEGGDQEGEADQDNEEEDEDEEVVEEEDAAAADDEAAAAAAMISSAEREQDLAQEVQRVLLGRVLPALHKSLVEKEWESVRPPVAVAIVKLLKVSGGLV